MVGLGLLRRSPSIEFRNVKQDIPNLFGGTKTNPLTYSGTAHRVLITRRNKFKLPTHQS